MRHCLQSFSEVVELKLQLNDDKKANWHDEGTTIGVLLRLLRHEVDELEDALINQAPAEAILECADVAAFAMMIACKMKGCKLSRAGEPLEDPRH